MDVLFLTRLPRDHERGDVHASAESDPSAPPTFLLVVALMIVVIAVSGGQAVAQPVTSGLSCRWDHVADGSAAWSRRGWVDRVVVTARTYNPNSARQDVEAGSVFAVFGDGSKRRVIDVALPDAFNRPMPANSSVAWRFSHPVKLSVSSRGWPTGCSVTVRTPEASRPGD